jgi:ABC-type transporter MlaC component
MNLRRVLPLSLLSLSLTLSGSARADTPDGFIKTGQTGLTGIIRQPASGQRDAQVTATLDKLVDYAELARRCFREDWAQLGDAQKTEVTELLHKVVDRSYRKNLVRTVGYTVTYTGARAVGSDTLVRTEAKSTTNLRDPVVQIDYVVAGAAAGPFHIVDIVTAGSSLTNFYYTTFHKMLATAGQGYPYVVTKLRDALGAAPTSAASTSLATVSVKRD